MDNRSRLCPQEKLHALKWKKRNFISVSLYKDLEKLHCNTHKYYWEAAPVDARQKLVVPTFGDGDAGSRVWGSGGIYTVSTDYGPLQGNGTDAGDVGRKKVVVAGGAEDGGSTVGGRGRIVEGVGWDKGKRF